MAVKQEITDFVAGTLQATVKKLMKWEATADPMTYTAPLEKGYTVRLEAVPDFEGSSDERDHVLSLLKSGKVVFQVDRRALDLVAINQKLNVRFESVFQLFSLLWEEADLSAQVVPPEVDEVSRLLWSRLKPE